MTDPLSPATTARAADPRRRLARFALPALLVALLALTACQTTLGGYLEDRAHDTLDVFPMSVGTGPGLYAGVRVTAFFGTAIGLESTHRHGWRRANWNSRNTYEELARPGSWDESAHGLLLFWGRSNDRRPKDKEKYYLGNALFVIPLDYGTVVKRSSSGEKPTGFTLQDVQFDVDLGTSLDCEAEIHLGYVGLRFGLSPVQLADWLAGWFQVDFADDDRNARFPETEAESRP